jgi:hypothetical protein
MGERPDRSVFRPEFNRSLRVQTAPADRTDELGALALRQTAEQIGLLSVLSELYDPRDPQRITYPLADLVLTRLLLLGQGWRDQDDADALRDDPALRAAVATGRGEAVVDRPLCSQPTVSRMMGVLSFDYNRDVLADGLLKVSLQRASSERSSSARLTLDVDSFPVLAHGHQEGACYNGYYQEVIFHPLLVLADLGDLLAVDLRPGNVATSSDVRLLLEPVLSEVTQRYAEVWLRSDSGFADGVLFDWLEEKQVRYICALRSNAVLVRSCAGWRERISRKWASERAAGAELREARLEFRYRAGDWRRARRVLAVLVERRDRDGSVHEALFFLCTNVSRRRASQAHLLQHYRQRGTAEARIGEFVGQVLPNLSSHTHDRNEATLRLAALAYEVLHALRRRLETAQQRGLSLRRLRERVLSVSARCVRHARRLLFRVGESLGAAWQELAMVLSAPSPPVATSEGSR